jgi:hypothetical protein
MLERKLKIAKKPKNVKKFLVADNRPLFLARAVRGNLFGRGDGRGRKLQHGFPHFLAGLEFDDCAAGDGDVGFGAIGIAADAGFANFDLEDAEITQFHGGATRHSVGNVIKCSLDYNEHLLLYQSSLFTDADY